MSCPATSKKQPPIRLQEVDAKTAYRILTADGRAKNAGTGRPSWFTLEEAKREYDPGAGEIIIEIDPGTGRKLWEVIP